MHGGNAALGVDVAMAWDKREALAGSIVSEGAKGQKLMSDILLIPPSIEEVIQSFDQTDAPFTVRDVNQALSKARPELQKPTKAEDFGAWAEILAFALVGNKTDASPWDLIHPLILLSNDTKDFLEYPLLHKHLQKPLHQWTDSLIRPVGNMVIQHQPLTKQRVRSIFHRVRL